MKTYLITQGQENLDALRLLTAGTDVVVLDSAGTSSITSLARSLLAAGKGRVGLVIDHPADEPEVVAFRSNMMMALGMLPVWTDLFTVFSSQELAPIRSWIDLKP